MVSKSIPDSDMGSISFDPVRGVCPFGLTIRWDTTTTLCLHGGGRVFGLKRTISTCLSRVVTKEIPRKTRFD